MTELEVFTRAANATPQICAPYTFVPTPTKVLASPTEALDLSRPVEDAISGTLTMRWTAETPLLVGGQDNNSPLCLDGQYSIPGASIRGLIRATLEIATFARLSFIDEFTGYTRNTQDQTWKDLIQPHQGMPINGGWLFFAGGKYHLLPAKETRPYSFADLLNDFEVSRADWHDMNLHNRLTLLRKRNRYGLQAAGNEKRQIVVSGATADAPAFRNPATGKDKEHIFVWPDDKTTVEISTATATQFLTSLNHDARNATPPAANYSALTSTGRIQDLRDRKNRAGLQSQLEQPDHWGLPVFWRNRRSRNSQTKPTSNTILSLTAMLRVPYETTLHQIIARTQSAAGNDYDFVQALFGWAPEGDVNPVLAARTDQEKALASRVRFGFAHSSNATLGQPQSWAATQPKPSFFPFYLRPQNGQVAHPVDYNNPGAVLAGRKRYPARAEVQQLPAGNNDDMISSVTFLKAGASFSQTIRLHNVTPIELGALLWALTFGQIGDNDLPEDHGYRHMLGRAKSFGYGQVRGAIEGHNLAFDVKQGQPKLGESIEAFKGWVSGQMGQPFDEIETIRLLLSTAHAKTGKQVSSALRFPKAHGASEMEQTLKAYVAIKDKALKSKGKRVSEHGGIGLPPYPSEQDS